MRNIDLDRAFAPTPAAFSQGIDRTLLSLKEEPVKKITLRAVVIAAVITILLAGIAYAVIQYSQEWYFNTRYSNYPAHQPEKYQAIMDKVMAVKIQENTGAAAEIVRFEVQESAWAEDQEIATISLVSQPKDEKTYELHDLGEVDTDGAVVGRIDPDDEESRMDHFLWTTKGFGLPKDTMMDPSKQLLLINQWGRIFIGDTDAEMPQSSGDMFTTPEGPVMTIKMFDLTFLDDQKIEAKFNKAQVPEGMDKVEYLKMIEESIRRLKNQATASQEAIEKNTDAEGYLSLRFPYELQTLKDNVFSEPIPGELRFKIKIR